VGQEMIIGLSLVGGFSGFLGWIYPVKPTRVFGPTFKV